MKSKPRASSSMWLDATKLVPEEFVPLKIVGQIVLDRNPDNFFAETEQIAFCPANVVPGACTRNWGARLRMGCVQSLKVIGHVPAAKPLLRRAGIAEELIDAGVVALTGANTVVGFIAAAKKMLSGIASRKCVTFRNPHRNDCARDPHRARLARMRCRRDHERLNLRQVRCRSR
jgi:hypothetical protein